MQPETLLNQRYLVTETIETRPDAQLLRASDTQRQQTVLIELTALAPPAREAMAALAHQIAGAQHPLLLPLVDHFATEGGYALVCPDLGKAVEPQQLSEREALGQMAALLDLVEQFHTSAPPICIGAVDPSDLRADAQGWQITPFPFARMVGDAPSPFQAPELAAPGTEPTPASDTYALCALLLHALTGAAPAAQPQRSADDASMPGIHSQLLARLLARGLQERAANRYQRAGELRRAIETVRLMEGESLGLGPDALPAAPPPQAPPEEDIRIGAGCWLAMGAAALLLIALAIVLVLFLSGGLRLPT